MVRLFIAVELPEEVKHEVSRIQRIINKSNVLVGTYPKPDAMHLTLKFMGDMPADSIIQIQKVLRTINFAKLQAQLTLLMTFGNPQFPKVIYVDVDCPKLAELSVLLNDKLKDFCKPEDREFKSHLTVVRVKQTIDSDSLLNLLDQTHVNPISFTIDHLNLMQSELASDGPKHTLVERYDLIS